MKSKGTAYLLWFFLGLFSAHRFYVGKTGSAILYLFTLQLFGIGWVIDLFLIGGMVDKYNLMHGFIGGHKGDVNQNVVINMPTAETTPAKTATKESNTKQIENNPKKVN